MKQVSYPQLQARYGGKFIAKLNNRIIAAAKTSSGLWSKVSNKVGTRGLVIEYIEPKEAICTYGISHP